jgi:cobalt/nickel transport system permease protein
MFNLFSDIFARRENVFTRLDARAKMIVAFALLFTVITSTKELIPLITFAACVLTTIALGIPGKLILFRLLGPLGIVSVLIVLQTFLTKGTILFSFFAGGWEITASWEGLMRGVLMGSRVLGAVSVIILLGSVTPAHKMFQALRWFRVPEGWVEIALLVYRYTFTLLDQTADIAAAQSARLGYSTVRRSISSLGVLAGTVITRSIDQAMRTCEAMELRGYHGSYPFGSLPKMNRSDLCLIAAVIPVITACYLITEWWPL